MSDIQSQAIRLLSRRRGATVEELTKKLELPSTDAARGLITRLRRRGEPISNIGLHRFQLARS